MRFVWMFENSNQFILMVSLAELIITFMASIDCQLSEVGSGAGCIGVAVVLCTGVTRQFMYTFALSTVQKRKYKCVA